MSDQVAEASLHLPAVAVTVIDGVAQVVMVTDERGEPELFPIRRASKKAAVRFAAGEPGRRGTIWRLWASRDTDDVYLASRHTAGEMKISLHQSGDWRMQIVEPERPKTVVVRSFGDGFDGRILLRWARPQANAVGWTRAFSLVLPGHHLVTIPEDHVEWEDVRWYPAPAAGEQVTFEIHVVAPQQGLMSYQGLLLEGGAVAVMDALHLASGEVAVVLAIRSVTTAEEAAYVAHSEELAISERLPRDMFDPSPVLGPRMMVFGSEAGGEPRIYDFAYGALFDRDSP